MSRFDGLFEKHQNEQRKMYEELYTFVSSRSVIEKYSGFACSRGRTFEVESTQVASMYCTIKCDATGSEDMITVRFKGNSSKKAVINQIKERCSDLEVNGEGTGADPWVSFRVENLDEAESLWKDFVE